MSEFQENPQSESEDIKERHEIKKYIHPITNKIITVELIDNIRMFRVIINYEGETLMGGNHIIYFRDFLVAPHDGWLPQLIAGVPYFFVPCSEIEVK